MSDEKENKQDKPTVLGEVKILVLSDGNVTVVGPVDNPVVMMNIFSRAMAAVANHVAMKENENGIVVPQEPPLVSLN
ncbi:MAG: hypothetical protein IMF11_18980 [Proteobacteria bacterium]|nr:hypothetical protein [Pseudomonadota bacterium]